MELFESDWFFSLVETQAKTPAARLTAVFSVSATWLSAPGIHERVAQSWHPKPCIRLKDWLTAQAQIAKARHPAILASQLLILLQGAVAEELRQPGSHALEDAATAAQAVVAQACRRSPAARRAVVASVLLMLAAGITWHALSPLPRPVMQAHLHANDMPGAPRYQSAGMNPDEMEEVLALQERIERGICPPPNLLQLPEGQMTAYMNAVNFRTPENPEADRKNIRAFLTWFEATRARECYLSPHNGHTQIHWR